MLVASNGYRMGFVDQAKGVLRTLLIRLVLLLIGGAGLILSLRINLNAGNEVLAGLRSPDSSFDIVVSVARLAAPTLSLWLIYRALR